MNDWLIESIPFSITSATTDDENFQKEMGISKKHYKAKTYINVCLKYFNNAIDEGKETIPVKDCIILLYRIRECL
jgi:hypothetical protein